MLCTTVLQYILVYFNYPIMLYLKYLYVTPRWSGSKFGWSLELHKALRVPALYTECTIHKYPTRRKLNVPCSYHQYPKKCWRFHFHPIRMSWQLLIFHLFLLSEIWPKSPNQTWFAKPNIPVVTLVTTWRAMRVILCFFSLVSYCLVKYFGGHLVSLPLAEFSWEGTVKKS